MKKLFALSLAALMVMSLATVAFAATGVTPVDAVEHDASGCWRQGLSRPWAKRVMARVTAW
jgi:hypothetical protein